VDRGEIGYGNVHLIQLAQDLTQ